MIKKQKVVCCHFKSHNATVKCQTKCRKSSVNIFLSGTLDVRHEAHGVCSPSSLLKSVWYWSNRGLSQGTSGLWADLQEFFMGLINSANSVFRWNRTRGEAIRDACISSAFFFPALRSASVPGHSSDIYLRRWLISCCKNSVQIKHMKPTLG